MRNRFNALLIANFLIGACALLLIFCSFIPELTPSRSKCLPHSGSSEVCDSIYNLYYNDAICMLLANCRDTATSALKGLIIPDSLVKDYAKRLCSFYNNIPDSLDQLRNIHFNYQDDADFHQIVISVDDPGKLDFDPANRKFGPPALDSLLKECGLVYERESHTSANDYKDKANEMPGFNTNFYYFRSGSIINPFLFQRKVESVSTSMNAWNTIQISRDRGSLNIIKKNGAYLLQVFEIKWKPGGNYSLTRRTFDVSNSETILYCGFLYPASYDY